MLEGDGVDSSARLSFRLMEQGIPKTLGLVLPLDPILNSSRVYEVLLRAPLVPRASVAFHVHLSWIRRLVNLPSRIQQADVHLVTLEAQAYFTSPYLTKTQTVRS